MKKYIITGSRAFGGSCLASDLDIVLYADSAKWFNEFLNQLGIEIEHLGDYSSFYFKIPDYPKINIISVENESEFNEWKFATKQMMKIDTIKNRDERIRTFKSFRQQYKEDNCKESDMMSSNYDIPF